MYIYFPFTHGAGRLDGSLRLSTCVHQQHGLDFLTGASFLIERLMLLRKLLAYMSSFAVPLRIVLWQQVGDLRPLSGISKEKWPVRAGAQTQDPELVSTRPSPPLLNIYIKFNLISPNLTFET